MPSYASIRDRMKRSLKRKGQAFTFRRTVDAAPAVPADDWIVAPSNPVNDIVRPDAAHQEVLYLFWEEPGGTDPTDGAANVREAWLPIFDLEPRPSDFIEVPGDSWQIVSDPMPFRPGGFDTMWKVRLRKWPTISPPPTT